MKTRLVLLIMLVAIITAFSEIKDLGKTDFESMLKEIGSKAEPALVDRYFSSRNTIGQINNQTKGKLDAVNWIEIFQKLNLTPKDDMQINEWEFIFARMGIKPEQKNATLTTEKATVNSAAQPQPEKSAVTSTEQPQPEKPAVTNTGQPLPRPSSDTPQQPQPVSGLNKDNQSSNVNDTDTSLQQQIQPVKITLDLRGTDILTALRMISNKLDVNIIAGNNVRGQATLYLKEVDALDALKMLLEMNNLAYIYEDNVIKVMTAQDYENVYGKVFYDRKVVEFVPVKNGKADRVSKLLVNFKSKIAQVFVDNGSNSLIILDTPSNIKELKKFISILDVKINTKTFAINYTRAEDVAAKIKDFLTPDISDMRIDEKNSQLIINDTPSKLEELSRLIGTIDKRHKEVLIEAKVIQLIYNNDVTMGISWEKLFNSINGQAMPGKIVANMSGISGPSSIALGGETGIQLSVGTLEINSFTGVIDMLQSLGKTNLVSSPRLAVIDGKEAKILVGTKEAYVTTQVTNPGNVSVSPVVAESVSFIDVGMKLFVTPEIGDDNFVTMRIKPELSAVERILRTSQNNPIPIVRTSESETTIMVKDGITIVIAGLMEEKETKKYEGIPLLSKIPILGIPFRRTVTGKVKTELIVFLTPRIMTGDMTSTEAVRK